MYNICSLITGGSDLPYADFCKADVTFIARRLTGTWADFVFAKEISDFAGSGFSRI